jgi:hypothetical protein
LFVDGDLPASLVLGRIVPFQQMREQHPHPI